MTTKKKPKLQLKKQTLAKLDDRELEKSKGGALYDDYNSTKNLCNSMALKCLGGTLNHNRRVLAAR